MTYRARARTRRINHHRVRIARPVAQGFKLLAGIEQQRFDDNPFVDAAYAAAAAPAWRKVRRQILGTAAFVFVTFLLRAVFSTMSALANELQDYGVSIIRNGNDWEVDVTATAKARAAQQQ